MVDIKTPNIPKQKQFDQMEGKNKNIVKTVLIGALALLLGALGLEFTNNDFDLGSLLKGESLQDAKVQRDESGNILFDKEGNVTTNSTIGKKASDYNCADFKTQAEAQSFFQKVGRNDLYGLDGDKDGEACEVLPRDTR